MAGAPERLGRAGGNIAQQRLRTQRLAGAGFRTPADVVRWFGAVQAQDYPGALWAVGLRTIGATEADVERAVAERTIVRTWPLRGTLHFVAPEDVRWMLTYFAPRMIARAAPRFKQLELDARTLRAERGGLDQGAAKATGSCRGRSLYARLERAGISDRRSRGLHILWHCAHDGLICFGAREGNQHTFALLDEWMPRGEDARLATRRWRSSRAATSPATARRR